MKFSRQGRQLEAFDLNCTSELHFTGPFDASSITLAIPGQAGLVSFPVQKAGVQSVSLFISKYPSVTTSLKWVRLRLEDTTLNQMREQGGQYAVLCHSVEMISNEGLHQDSFEEGTRRHDNVALSPAGFCPTNRVEINRYAQSNWLI